MEDIIIDNIDLMKEIVQQKQKIDEITNRIMEITEKDNIFLNKFKGKLEMNQIKDQKVLLKIYLIKMLMKKLNKQIKKYKKFLTQKLKLTKKN